MIREKNLLNVIKNRRDDVSVKNAMIDDKNNK